MTKSVKCDNAEQTFSDLKSKSRDGELSREEQIAYSWAIYDMNTFVCKGGKPKQNWQY